MAAIAHALASGPGWRVDDVRCTAGPLDRPFEERHDTVCIAMVTQGTFQYRSTQGAAVMAPGALMLGNAGSCFECGHDHGIGDRCLSFHFAPEYLENVVAGVPGIRRTTFAVPRLPAVAKLLPLVAAAEAAREDGDNAAFEELALDLCGSVAALAADATWRGCAPNKRDERRISETLRRIEAMAHDPLTLRDLAHGAAMSPYHFLRTFRAIVGMTPYQFVLHRRLHRAATRLRCSDDGVSAIAWDTGFSDLSTFNRRFRRLIGLTPSAYRRSGSDWPG